MSTFFSGVCMGLLLYLAVCSSAAALDIPPKPDGLITHVLKDCDATGYEVLQAALRDYYDHTGVPIYVLISGSFRDPDRLDIRGRIVHGNVYTGRVGAQKVMQLWGLNPMGLEPFIFVMVTPERGGFEIQLSKSVKEDLKLSKNELWHFDNDLGLRKVSCADNPYKDLDLNIRKLMRTTGYEASYAPATYIPRAIAWITDMDNFEIVMEIWLWLVWQAVGLTIYISNKRGARREKKAAQEKAKKEATLDNWS